MILKGQRNSPQRSRTAQKFKAGEDGNGWKAIFTVYDSTKVHGCQWFIDGYTVRTGKGVARNLDLAAPGGEGPDGVGAGDEEGLEDVFGKFDAEVLRLPSPFAKGAQGKSGRLRMTRFCERLVVGFGGGGFALFGGDGVGAAECCHAAGRYGFEREGGGLIVPGLQTRLCRLGLGSLPGSLG